MNPHLKCIALNCDSLVSLGRRKELESLIKRSNLHIALLSETHLGPQHKLRINGYTVYRADSGVTKSGGTAIVIKNGIPHFKAKAFKSPDSQATLLNIGTTDRHLTLCSIYVTTITETDILRLLNYGNKTIIAGDFNARHSAWNCATDNPNGPKLLDICSQANVQLNYSAKHTFPRGRSTLDLVLTKNISLTETPQAIDEFCSDHLPVLFKVTLPASHLNHKPEKAFNFAKADWLAFKVHIQRNLTVAPQIENANDIEQMTTLLTKVTNAAIKIAVPKTTLNQIKIPPALELQIQTRNQFTRWYYDDPTTCPVTKTEINRLSGRIRKTFLQLRNDKFRKRMEEVPENSTDIFNEIRKLQGRKTSPIVSIQKDQTQVIDPIEIAEVIASHYSKVHCQNEDLGNQQFDEEVRSHISDYLDSPPANIGIPLTDVKEVTNILTHLSKRKAPGVDEIPNSALRNLPEKATYLLTNIINGILKLGYFPKCWKVGKIIPIPKPGKPPNRVENTRPITLLNGLSKVTEAIMLSRLQPFFNSRLPEEQFGFRAKHSSTQAILRLKNHILNTKRFGKSTVAVFLDIEKAFDTVWHNGLIYKLITCGFPFYLVKLVNSYLNGRKFFVSINNKYSSTRNISAGVAQGSLIGPHLFSFYYHDIPRHNETQMQIYADDTAIYTSSTSAKLSCDRIQEHLGTYSAYADKWKIKVNSAKTELIHFFERKNSKLKPVYPICFQGSIINFQNQVKYLGVVLDKKLSATPQLDHIKKRAFTAFNSLYPFLNRNSNLSQKNKLRIYKTYLRPVLTYAVPAWMGELTEAHWKKVSVHQNRALRFVFDKWPIPPDYKHCRITDLEALADIESLVDFSSRLQTTFIEKASSSESALIRSIPCKWDQTNKSFILQ